MPSKPSLSWRKFQAPTSFYRVVVGQQTQGIRIGTEGEETRHNFRVKEITYEALIGRPSPNGHWKFFDDDVLEACILHPSLEEWTRRWLSAILFA